jgi:hypothetical protein
MKTTIEIECGDFLINGRRTYSGVTHEGRPIEGLLMNSRMVQAIFDDECAETRGQWAYPDTGRWDPQRNTDEFCSMLPVYRDHGLMGVTVGLQGGGSVYTSPVYENYINTAFRPDGSLKHPYLDRLLQVLKAADECGMIVIVNYFYWRQERFEGDAAIRRAVAEATGWLLETGFGNVLVDMRNEITEGDGLLHSGGIHDLLDIVRSTTRHGRRLLVGASTHPVKHLPGGKWPAYVDFFMPHGNDSQPDAWRTELRALKTSEPLKMRPRPVCCNEDSIDIRNMEVCLDEGCSWGYYDQGYGCGQKQGKHDWAVRGREGQYEHLSGFQTLPVNWSINTDHKRAFFSRLSEVTGMRPGAEDRPGEQTSEGP